jgi:hypothetical protein
MPKLTLDEKMVHIDAREQIQIADLQRDAITIDLNNIIKERDTYIKTLEQKLKVKPTSIDIDEDDLLLFANSLIPADHPSVKSLLIQLQIYQKKHWITDSIKLIKMFMRETRK